MNSPATTSDLQRFAASVENTLTALTHLESVLQIEQVALTGHAPEELEQAVRAKLSALATLEPLVMERDAIQQRLGAEIGLQGGTQLLSSAPSAAPIRQQWDQLTAMAIRVEQLNTQNRQLAMQGEQSAQVALSILTGRPHEPSLYGKQGHSGKRLTGASLAKA